LPVTVIIKEPTMPTYISLTKYTQQGISTIKDGPGRLDANKEILNRFGSELKAFYLPGTSQPRPCGPSPRTNTARS
jgi:uncharacterized protein with GYD domain